MFFLISIFVLVNCHLRRVSAECESNATLWTYYPCSFIISPTLFYCQHVSIIASIDECSGREMTFFWHFPLGNMTLTLHSDKNHFFLIRLSKNSLLANKLIKHVYHAVNHRTSEERLPYHDQTNPIITLYSDQYQECSMKFETTNANIYDYGTFIRMTPLIDEGPGG
jgi:hypothetical protein